MEFSASSVTSAVELFFPQRMGSTRLSVQSDERGSAAPEGLRAKWDARYEDGDRLPEPARVLTENLHLLPASGRALDLASGLGANALLLSERGFTVSAWDLSPVAIERLREEGGRRGLSVDARVRDLQQDPPAPASFDVVVVAHFLDRTLAPAIAAALRRGGLLFYQTFTREAVSACGPSNPDYRLGVNELLQLFPDLFVRFYREEGRLGDVSRGTRDLAQLVAQRPG
jgi:SAM-dependent methyltransferase